MGVFLFTREPQTFNGQDRFAQLIVEALNRRIGKDAAGPQEISQNQLFTSLATSFRPPDRSRAARTALCAFASGRARPSAFQIVSAPPENRRSPSLQPGTRSSGKSPCDNQ